MMKFLSFLRELTPLSLIIRLSFSMLIGGYFGWEREQKNRAAGFRTYMLVSMGATLTMLISQYEYTLVYGVLAESAKIPSLSIDISRLGAQVINGIGFLGAGTILVNRRQEVTGITTAAGLWVSGCMGLALGAGFYECVFVGFLLMELTIRILPIIEKYLIRNAVNMNIYIEFQHISDVRTIVRELKEKGIYIYEVELEQGGHRSSQSPNAILFMRLPEHSSHERVLARLSRIEKITLIQEIY
ncbi:MAG TPA: Mg2+ transporter-C family protein [Oribacterium sp.]|nr:Mg2+ transporter-C family protein [Oribacterium sp.]